MEKLREAVEVLEGSVYGDAISREYIDPVVEAARRVLDAPPWMRELLEGKEPDRVWHEVHQVIQEAFMAGWWQATDYHNIDDSVAYPSEFERWFESSGYRDQVSRLLVITEETE